MPLPSLLQAALPVADWQSAGFGLYLHWPFCQSKCPYCDFNSHVTANIDQTRWAAAYVAEIQRAGRVVPGRKLDSIFFGGGTPSLMDPKTVDTILRAVRDTWALSNTCEITLEANPTSVEAARFEGYRDAGVNRVSLGVQSLNDTDLRRLGRLHSASDARRAFDVARNTFDRVSFDLIYARQDQSLCDWQSELSLALEMAIDHLSLYQLTIEPGTAFGERHARGGLSGLPDEDLSADMYDMTLETCAAHGLGCYEISNFCKPGSESRHNMLYWSAGDYVGIGPGAHGRLTLNNGGRHATVAPSAPGLWLDKVESGQTVETDFNRLSGQDRAEEYLMMGLRTTCGISLGRLMGMGADDGLPERLAEMEHQELLSCKDDMVRTTQRGRNLLNAVLRELLVG